MAARQRLIQVLDMITEGSEATVAESLKPEVAQFHQSSKPWVEDASIQGLGIGPKITNGETRDELVVKVYVDEKKPISQVQNIVPTTIYVPGTNEEIKTDVEAIGKIEEESNKSRVRPVSPGFSLGHPNITAGTFGCLVRVNGDENNLYILSNSHVLADSGLGAAGDNITQPGKSDGGLHPADTIANLSRWQNFIFTDVGFPNLIDAAIARVVDPNLVSSTIHKIGLPLGVSHYLRRDMRVKKTGRTTDFTTGLIRDIDFRTAILFNQPGGVKSRVGFRDQVLCTRFTSGGDSGSAILNPNNKVVGLHFAGSPSSSIFNKIGNVLNILDISVVTEQL